MAFLQTFPGLRRARQTLAFLLLVMAGLPSLAAHAEWGLNDVTILYPLPESSGEMNWLLAPQEAGLGGPLLPAKYWSRVPPIHQGENTAQTYRNLRVVAVRIDPCFKYRGDCLAQIRFVWQPIGRAVYGSASPFGLEAKDAAVHTFYTLDPDTFQQFLDEYDSLRRASRRIEPNVPLQVHPVIAREGLGGAFSTGLRKLLLKVCGEKTLWRVTSMSTLVGGDKWSFTGFNIQESKPVNILIPRTGSASAQTFSVSLVSDREYSNGQIAPAPAGEDNLNVLLQDSRSLAGRDADTLRRLGESVARIENPGIHSPETLDCVSCHSTQVAGSLLFTRINWLKNDPQILQHVYRSASSLLNLAATQAMPRVFRALGYFEKVPVLSRRVINETAAVVERLNKNNNPALDKVTIN